MSLFISLLLYLFTSYQGSGILHENVKYHPFSDPNQNDRFELVMDGDSILNSSIHFRIISYTGDTLFQEDYTYEVFIPFKYQIQTNEDRRKSIMNRFNNFFDDERFISPAIPENKEFEDYINSPPGFRTESDYDDLDLWKDIKSDRTAIGFSFTLYLEFGRTIAYSKSKNEVVVYSSCC